MAPRVLRHFYRRLLGLLRKDHGDKKSKEFDEDKNGNTKAGAVNAVLSTLTTPLTADTTHELSPYIYEPLQEGKWIRVLRLLPGSFDDPIRCELILTKLEKAAPYEPISYCWGDTNNRRQIWCHSQQLSITVSLFEALRRFRRETEARLLWADGICIDQTSTLEKNRSVAFMDQVYSRGECTLIWLGECSKSVDTAGGISLIEEFDSYMNAELDRVYDVNHDNVWVTLNNIPPLSEEHALAKCVDRWDGVRELLDRPWFGRVWVQQEVGLSCEALASCGKHSINFSKIVLFAAFCRHMSKYSVSCRSIEWARIMNGLDSIWNTFGMSKSWMDDGSTLEKMRDHYRQVAGSMGITDVLNTGRSFGATVEADHIYAFLGHPSAKGEDGVSSIIDPAYDRPVEETSRLLAERICVSSRSLRLLCFVQHWDDEDVEGTAGVAVPSWVPLWHQAWRYGVLSPHRELDALMLSKTADGVVIAVAASQLHVAAVLLDHVVATSSPLPHDQEKLPEFIESCWHIHSNVMKSRQSPQEVWAYLLWNIVRAYYQPECLLYDFVAFCRERCSPDFYDLVTRQPYFANAAGQSSNANAYRFNDEALNSSFHKRYFATKKNVCGMGLRPTRAGDVLAVIFGCPLPVLLRPTDATCQYKLVGQAYSRDLIVMQVVESARVTLWKNPCEIVLV